MLSETVDKAIDVFGMLQAPVTISYQTFLKRLKAKYPVDKEPYLCQSTGGTKYAYTIPKIYTKQILTDNYFRHAYTKLPNHETMCPIPIPRTQKLLKKR